MSDRITYCDVIDKCEDCPKYGDDCDGDKKADDLIRRSDAIEAVRKIVPVETEIDSTLLDKAEVIIELSALPSANMKSWNGLHIKVYADDDPQDKAEKLYQICDSNEALAEVAKCIQGYLDDPSAEAVQGEWIDMEIPCNPYPPIFCVECSMCGYRVGRETFLENTFNFCPNCGAKMKGGDSE